MLECHWSVEIYNHLKAAGVRQVAYVPDAGHAQLIELFQADPAGFALTMVDLTMPRMDGAEVFSALRRIQPDVRVLLMSGFNEQEAIARFAGKGLAGFLQKPFRLSDLREKAQQILAD